MCTFVKSQLDNFLDRRNENGSTEKCISWNRRHKKINRRKTADLRMENIYTAVGHTDMYEVPDAVPPNHAVSSHVATDKDPSKFRSIFSDNLQPIATRGKIARGVDIGCSSERAPPSVSYYNEISSSHIWRGC